MKKNLISLQELILKNKEDILSDPERLKIIEEKIENKLQKKNN